LRSKFDTSAYVANSPVPKLIIHGGSDTTVSPRSAERIYAAAAKPKQTLLIPGGDHDGLDLVDPELYHGVLRGFLADSRAL
jgi:hypothetical protein